MTSFERIMHAVALAPVAVAAPLAAQEVPEIAGDWHGAVSTPAGDLMLVATIERGESGELSGTLESRDQAPGQTIGMTTISVTGDTLGFTVAPLNASYEGVWDEGAQQWVGTWTQGMGLPLNLSAGQPDAKPVVEGLDGRWSGAATRNGVSLRQVLRVETGARGTNALLDSPDQMAIGVPVQSLSRDGRTVRFSIMNGASTFTSLLSEDGTTMEGAWSAPGYPDVPVTLVRESGEQAQAKAKRPQLPVPPFPYTVEEVAFDNPAAAEVRLAGTLTLPEGEGPFPAAILISGSGPQDRDETLMGHKPFAVIADHLTRSGIAVLRYDDRGVGQSTGNHADATSADFAKDANTAFAYLVDRTEIRGDAIGFIGHSEGAMIAPIAMAENGGAGYFISLAGPGTELDNLLLTQRRLIGAQMGMSEEELDRSEPIIAAMFDAIANAESEQAGLDAAMEVLTPEAKTALGMPAEMDSAVIVRRFAGPWFRYFLTYEPIHNLQRIDVPVLALGGSLDRQVPPGENLAAFRMALADNPDAMVIELEGLNHLFQTAETGALGEYADIEETFAPVALEAMSDWILARFGTR